MTVAASGKVGWVPGVVSAGGEAEAGPDAVGANGRPSVHGAKAREDAVALADGVDVAAGVDETGTPGSGGPEVEAEGGADDWPALLDCDVGELTD